MKYFVTVTFTPCKGQGRSDRGKEAILLSIVLKVEAVPKVAG